MEASKKKRNLVRIAIAVALVAALGLKWLDVSARKKQKYVYDQVSDQLDLGAIVTASQIHELVGEPDDGYSPEKRKWVDCYRYRGAFKEFVVLVKYNDAAARLLEGVEIE